VSSSPSHSRHIALVGLLLLIAGPTLAVPTVEQVLDNLGTPVRLTAPSGDHRLFVVQQNGLVQVFDRDGNERGTFLDWSDRISTGGERGLLGLAFAPDYERSGRFYINYTNNGGDTRVDRLRVNPANADRALPDSAEPILTVDQPLSNHNGGQLAFGPDGMLYVGLGDGGGAGDPDGNGQNGNTLLGAMLRLDVSGDGPGYRVPADNPYVQDPAVRDEIWALGLRNPWVYSFDRLTGDLYMADVGQTGWEEINVQPAESPGGENYGWNTMEGPDCYNPPPEGCNPAGLTLPAHAYAWGGSPFRCSISGGFVLRDNNVPDLRGRYLYSDFCANQIWSLAWNEADGLGEIIDHTAELTPTGGYGAVVGICEDGLGSLYVVDRDGEVWRIIDDDTTSVDLPPARDVLHGAQPNPFNPQTELSYALAADGPVEMSVHDLAGRRVAVLERAHREAGDHRLAWDGRDDRGQALASGVYLVRLRTLTGVQSQKVTLAR